MVGFPNSIHSAPSNLICFLKLEIVAVQQSPRTLDKDHSCGSFSCVPFSVSLLLLLWFTGGQPKAVRFQIWLYSLQCKLESPSWNECMTGSTLEASWDTRIVLFSPLKKKTYSTFVCSLESKSLWLPLPNVTPGVSWRYHPQMICSKCVTLIAECKS